ncbi:UNVERIFIED_CONTAM: hypothetical protein Sradi_7114800 [Sesamum radiatum]|uniref:DUF4283 domain-containing protein n=1 Tax=Sesamum radiatum TaxID=300843 RepID=A0AAW2J2E2_SESRA
MEEVIEGGPWLFHGQAIVLQKWEPGMVLRKLQHTQVPVWIRLRHLPVELWTTKGLSIVASGVGKPLYPDAITRACTRLDFARVCVMLDISAKLLTHIVIMIPKEDGSEMACKVDVEYEWLPPKCTACHNLGHSTKECPTTKPKVPPVTVYVQKPTVQPQPRREQRQPTRPVQQPRVPRPRETHGGDEVGNIASGSHEDKGKEIVLYNAFDKLLELDSDDATMQETRVAVGNVARVQRGLLPQWTYYVDYGGPGNRVWLAWDTDFVDVTVVETGAQFIHSDTPWLVGGDFNTVLDSSEVCGQSGDISGAADEFRGCLQDTGLIPVPVHGGRTRIMSLSARTSDHSPLVLRGDAEGRTVGMFRFDNYLARSAEFIPSVQSIWRHRIVGSAMYAVTRKLKALKTDIQGAAAEER